MIPNVNQNPHGIAICFSIANAFLISITPKSEIPDSVIDPLASDFIPPLPPTLRHLSHRCHQHYATYPTAATNITPLIPPLPPISDITSHSPESVHGECGDVLGDGASAAVHQAGGLRPLSGQQEHVGNVIIRGVHDGRVVDRLRATATAHTERRAVIIQVTVDWILLAVEADLHLVDVEPAGGVSDIGVRSGITVSKLMDGSLVSRP